MIGTKESATDTNVLKECPVKPSALTELHTLIDDNCFKIQELSVVVHNLYSQLGIDKLSNGIGVEKEMKEGVLGMLQVTVEGNSETLSYIREEIENIQRYLQ